MTQKAYVYNKQLDDTFYLECNEDGDVWIYDYNGLDVTAQLYNWFETLKAIPWEDVESCDYEYDCYSDRTDECE